MPIHGVVSGVNKQFTKHYGLASGVNKEIQSIYGVAGGVNKQVYQNALFSALSVPTDGSTYSCGIVTPNEITVDFNVTSINTAYNCNIYIGFAYNGGGSITLTVSYAEVDGLSRVEFYEYYNGVSTYFTGEEGYSLSQAGKTIVGTHKFKILYQNGIELYLNDTRIARYVSYVKKDLASYAGNKATRTVGTITNLVIK